MVKLSYKFRKHKHLVIKIILAVLIFLIGMTYQAYQEGFWSTNMLVARYNISKLQKTISSNPNNSDALVELGINYYIVKDFNKAIEAYMRATSLNPDDFMAWNNLGNVHRDLVDFWLAQDAYEKSLEINSNYIPAYLNLINLYAIWPEDEEGDNIRKKIIPTLEKALELNPENATLQATLKAYINSIK